MTQHGEQPKVEMKNMGQESFIHKYRTALFGLLGGLTFILLCLLASYINGGLVLLMLYIPGSIFGVAMTAAMRKYSDIVVELFLLSTLEYLLMIFLCSKDFEYLALRRFLMGGIGAVLFLMTVHLLSSIKPTLYDYIVGFILGIASTFFMWIDNFEAFDFWRTMFSIVLWQILIAALINRRELATLKDN